MVDPSRPFRDVQEMRYPTATRCWERRCASVPEGVETAIFGMGCFWEPSASSGRRQASTRRRSATPGASLPTHYEEVCSGRTGHTEAVLVAYDTAETSYQEMLKLFWETTTPPRNAPETTSARSTVGDPLERRRAASCRRGFARRLPGDAVGLRIRRDHHRAAQAGRSTTPRTTTSSTSRRTPAATAGLAGPASPAPSA